jgi:DNA end-binding protein Ku
VKGYEVSGGKYMVPNKDEIKAAGDRGKVIHLREFVRAEDIDPVFYDRTYYAGSREDEDAFRLLHEALRKTGRARIGRFSFHDRDYLIALRARDDVPVLHTLRFHDEVLSGDDLELDGGGRRPSEREIKMAGQLVNSMRDDFKPRAYEDTYRDAVLELIKRKAKGEEIDLVAQEEPAQGDDLAGSATRTATASACGA